LLRTIATAAGVEIENLDDFSFLKHHVLVGNWMFSSAYHILSTFCGYVEPNPNHILLMNRGSLGRWDNANRSSMSEEEKQQQDRVILMDLLPEFLLISRCRITPLFAADEFTRGLLSMIETNQIPIWLTFAATVFLQIHHTLGDEVLRGFETLSHTATTAKETLSGHADLVKNFKLVNDWLRINGNPFHKLSDTIDTSVFAVRTVSVLL
jgi:hypothetical protein